MIRRLFRYFRAFDPARLAAVLSMNQRNLQYIYPNNRRCDYPIADNKLITKTSLGHLVPVPETYLTYDSFFSLRNLARDLQDIDEFVIKPAQGSGGGGILIVKRAEDGWRLPGGVRAPLEMIRKHMTDILFGVYSFGMNDTVIVEEKIVPHPVLRQLSSFGLCDIRLILYKKNIAMAMLRAPTEKSGGKANLHQGAIGIGLDIPTGITTHAVCHDKPVSHHPDTGQPLTGVQLPMWQRLLSIGRTLAEHVPLGYLGVDLSLGRDTPVLLEINVRPGIAIQDINAMGLRKVLREIDGHG